MDGRLKKARGFTIIEVLVVLAVAGLILIVVLLTVPSLERSKANFNRKSDAANLAGVIREYMSEHGGTMPPLPGPVLNHTVFCTAANVATDCPFLQDLNFAHYTNPDSVTYVQINVPTAGNGATFINGNVDRLSVGDSFQCTPDHEAEELIDPPEPQKVVVEITLDSGGGTKTEECFDI